MWLFAVREIDRALLWLMRQDDGVANARRWLNLIGVVDDSAVPTEFYELYTARLEVPGIHASLRSLMGEGGSFGRMRPLTDSTAEVLEIDRPTAFVWGSEDYYWPPALGRSVARRMPDAVFHELPDHGHTPWFEPGDEAETHVRAFFDR